MGKLTEEQKAKRAKTREMNRLKEEENRLEKYLASQLDEVRKKVCKTNPIFSFKAGDKVKPRTANWNFMDILEVLDNGRVLKVCIDSTKNNYGNLKNEKNITYISHLDALP